MDILGKFSKRLFKLEAVNELDKRWKMIDLNSPYNTQSQSGLIKIPAAPKVIPQENTSLTPLINHKRAHAKLADMAARSYWRCDKSPNRVTLSYGKSVTSPIKVKLSYGKCANSASVTAKNLQAVR